MLYGPLDGIMYVPRLEGNQGVTNDLLKPSMEQAVEDQVWKGLGHYCPRRSHASRLWDFCSTLRLSLEKTSFGALQANHFARAAVLRLALSCEDWGAAAQCTLYELPRDYLLRTCEGAFSLQRVAPNFIRFDSLSTADHFPIHWSWVGTMFNDQVNKQPWSITQSWLRCKKKITLNKGAIVCATGIARGRGCLN